MKEFVYSLSFFAHNINIIYEKKRDDKNLPACLCLFEILTKHFFILNEYRMSELKKVSLRYDDASETYYCFYHQTTPLASELILSYDVKQSQWNVDTMEYKIILEDKLSQLFHEKNRSFEEQLPYVIDYLDTYFSKFDSPLN